MENIEKEEERKLIRYDEMNSSMIKSKVWRMGLSWARTVPHDQEIANNLL